MTSLRSRAVLVTVFAALVSASPQSQTRDIVLNLGLPNGATPQLKVTDGGIGTVELPDVGKFGFVPTLQQDNPGIVIVELFDLNRTPHRRMARLELIVAGATVQSDTSPRFAVRVPRLVTR
jgi:hypothetical protein